MHIREIIDSTCVQDMMAMSIRDMRSVLVIFRICMSLEVDIFSMKTRN